MRAPVAAIGCPREMPDPFTFNMSVFGSFHSRNTAKTCAAKASFNSIMSISSRERPSLDMTLLVEGTGPIPIVAG